MNPAPGHSSTAQHVLARLTAWKRRQAADAARADVPPPAASPAAPASPACLPRTETATFAAPARGKRRASEAGGNTEDAEDVLVPFNALARPVYGETETELTAEQLLRMQEQRTAAEDRREAKRRRENAERVMARPAQHESRPGGGGKSFAYLTMDAAVAAMHEAFGLSYSHTIIERTICSEELPRIGGASPRLVHFATAVCKITVRMDGEVKEHEAAGWSAMHTTAENKFTGRGNAIKSSESDAFKRAARFFGPACSTAPTDSPRTSPASA